MALFKTTCPDCGEVMVRDYELQMTPPAADGSAAYRFCCPDCCRTIERTASSGVVAILADGGVRQAAFRRAHEPAPISREDLLHFHELLVDDESLAAFLAGEDDEDRPMELPAGRGSADRSPRVRARQHLRRPRWWARRSA